MRSRLYLLALAGAITTSGGVLALILMQPAELDFSPFVYVAAASLVLAAAAGAWDWAERRRTRNSRRIIAQFRAAGTDMEAAGFFQTADRRLLADAYDVPKEGG